MMSDGGKGSAPRKQQDHDAYSKGWDAIFGRKVKILQEQQDYQEAIKKIDEEIEELRKEMDGDKP